MLTLMRVRNVNKVLKLEVPVIPTESSPYIIENIDGLGPVKATIVQQPFAFQDGAGYVSSHTGARNIVITLGYANGAMGKSVQQLRRELYAAFPTKTEIILNFVSDDFVTVTARGWVESHEPVLFSEEPQVQIVVLCLQPFLEGPNLVSVELDHIPGSSGTSSQYMSIKNEGDVATGLLYGVFFDNTAPDMPTSMNVLLDNLYPDGRRSVIVINSGRVQAIMGQKIRAGDTFYIESRPGHRGVSLVRGGMWYSVIGAIMNADLSLETQWSTLSPREDGANLINYSITGSTGGWEHSSAAATYTPLYEGI